MSTTTKKSVTKTVEEMGKKLYHFIRGKVGTAEDAEDIIQDVWYQLSHVGNLEQIENISAWLYRVARNKVTDSYRKKSNESLEDYGYYDDEEQFNFKDILLIDDTEDPALAYFKELFWKELLIALDELPENQKEVFILNEIEDFTLQQIADKKGENLKTIISRKGYAVKQLRKRLDYLYKELND